MSKILLIGLAFLLASTSSNADLSIFTEHQVVSMFDDHAVNQGQDVRFRTGDYPYIGKVGLKYKRKHLTYSVAYIHRSNIDVPSEEDYYYSGFAFGVEASKCFAYCK